MDESGRRSSLRSIVLVGVAYVVIGIGFAALAKPADDTHVRLWRLAAWVASAAAGGAHVAYEHYRLRSPPRVTALHAAAAVALGAFGLALAANVHWLSTGKHGRAPLLALPVWPVVTAVPVFLIVLAVATLLVRLFRRA